MLKGVKKEKKRKATPSLTGSTAAEVDLSTSEENKPLKREQHPADKMCQRKCKRSPKLSRTCNIIFACVPPPI